MLAAKSCNACIDTWQVGQLPWAQGEEGAAAAKGEALQLIWSHTMRDTLASKGALCKQRRGHSLGYK